MRSCVLIWAWLGIALSTYGCRSEATRYETCATCKSTRAVSAGGERVLYRSPRFNHGPHVWTEGLEFADPRSIPVGAIVLLKHVAPDNSKPAFGAVILTEQHRSPERVTYQWYLRSDGQGSLDPSDPAVEKGEAHQQSELRFGPFLVHWSG